MAKTSKYPRTLYRSGPDGTRYLKTAGVTYYYDSVIVNDESEQDAAEEMGYIDSFKDALFDPPEPIKESDSGPSDEEF